MDFHSSVGGVARLSESGRRILTTEYLRRTGQEFTHPLYAYRVTWRRAMEVQARLVLGVLDGTGPDYVGIRTR